MMPAIVYTSNTGFTLAYAKMLSQKINLPLYELGQACKTLPKNESVIFCGWLFAGRVKGYKKANKHFKISAVCGVGLGDTGSQIETVRAAQKIPQTTPLFTLQGGMKREELRGVNKFMIQMLIKMLERGERTEDEKKMLEMIKAGGDFLSESNLQSVLDWYKGE